MSHPNPVTRSCDSCGVTYTKCASTVGRFCTKRCAYRGRVRPTGLKYVIRNSNKGWFKGLQTRTFACATCKSNVCVSGARPHAKYCSQACYWSSMKSDTSQQAELRRIRCRAAYKTWRRAVLTRDGFKCVVCSATDHLNADHTLPFRLFPELRFDAGNGRTLCFNCHRQTDTYGARLNSLWKPLFIAVDVA